MNAIRIRKTIDSPTLHLPELTPFLGHTVDIVIEDRPTNEAGAQGVMPGTGDWDAFRLAARSLRDGYDYDALRDQDACDRADVSGLE